MSENKENELENADEVEDNTDFDDVLAADNEIGRASCRERV
jgi:hypothetical protein